MAAVPLPVVAISAEADEHFYEELKRHLGLLQRSGQITLWHDSQILPAFDIVQERRRHLEAARLVLLLLSAAFMSSEDCQGQLAEVLERQAHGSLLVLPIIVRPVDLAQTPLATIKALPRGGRPITAWANRDEAYRDIVQGIRSLVNALSAD